MTEEDVELVKIKIRKRVVWIPEFAGSSYMFRKDLVYVAEIEDNLSYSVSSFNESSDEDPKKSQISDSVGKTVYNSNQELKERFLKRLLQELGWIG